MPIPHRVRLGDGSVIDLEVGELKSWYESGLLTADTQVQRQGSKSWTRLGQAMDTSHWRKPAAARGVSVPAGPSKRKSAAPARTATRTPAAPRAPVDDARSEPLPLGRFARIAGIMAAVFAALYFAAPYVVPLIFGTAEQRRVKAATTAERTFADGTVGLTLAVPDGWKLLRRDHDLFASPAHTRVALVDTAAGAFAALAVETPPRGFVTLDAFLDRVLDDRRRSEPALRPLRWEDAPGGGRRVFATRLLGESAYDEVITAWKDGWTYSALVVWAPESSARAAAASDELRQAISVQGHMGGRLQQAVATVTAQVPLLTARAAELLMGQSQAQVLEPAEAFRRTYLLAGRGLSALSGPEQGEMGTLSGDMYAKLRAPDRARLGAYLDRVRAGRATEPAQDAEMGRLVKTAFAKMPAARQKRLQALFEKAIAAAATSAFEG